MHNYDVTLDGVTYRVTAENVTDALIHAVETMLDERVLFNVTTVTEVTIKRVGFAS